MDGFGRPSWTQVGPKLAPRGPKIDFFEESKKRVKFKTIFCSQATLAGTAVAARGLKSLNEMALARANIQHALAQRAGGLFTLRESRRGKLEARG